MSSLSAVHFSLPQACQPDVSPTMSLTTTNIALFYIVTATHTYTTTLIARFYSDATVAPPDRDASKRFYPPLFTRLIQVHIPPTTPDAAVLRYILAHRPCHSIDSLPSSFLSHPTSSHPTRHVPPLSLFSLRLTGQPTCLSACLACLTALLVYLLACMLVCLLGC